MASGAGLVHPGLQRDWGPWWKGKQGEGVWLPRRALQCKCPWPCQGGLGDQRGAVMASVQLVIRNLRGDGSQTPLSASLLWKWWGAWETGCEADRLKGVLRPRPHPCLPESM